MHDRRGIRFGGRTGRLYVTATLAMVLGLGCGSSRSDAEQACARLAECNHLQRFGSEQECREHFEQGLEGGLYDDAEVASCLECVEANQCGDVAEGECQIRCTPNRSAVRSECEVTPGSEGDVATATLEIGRMSSREDPEGERSRLYEPYEEGGTYELIPGFQGGTMLLPAFRLADVDSDADELCAEVELRNSSTAEVDVSAGWIAALTFYREGDSYYTDTHNNLIALDPTPVVGEMLTMAAKARGSDFEAADQVTVVLDIPE